MLPFCLYLPNGWGRWRGVFAQDHGRLVFCLPAVTAKKKDKENMKMKKMLFKATSVLLAFVLLFALPIPAFAAVKDLQTPFADSQFYHQGDYSIHYRVIEGKGEHKGYILFLHGFLYSGESFRPMAEEMSKAGYTCVLADFPNFGYSTRENAQVAPIDREVLMEGLMQSIAPDEQWILAGQSMGGGVALNIASDVPSVKALLLYAPAPINAMPSMMNGILTSGFTTGIFSGVLKLVAKPSFLVRSAMYMATMDWKYTNSYDLSTLTDPLAIDGTGEGLMYMMTRARGTDYDALAQLDLPILLVRGTRDLVVTKLMSAQMDNALSGATKVTVRGAGHMLNETHYKQLGAQAIEFLAAL